jgi:hypothetical protein
VKGLSAVIKDYIRKSAETQGVCRVAGARSAPSTLFPDIFKAASSMFLPPARAAVPPRPPQSEAQADGASLQSRLYSSAAAPGRTGAAPRHPQPRCQGFFCAFVLYCFLVTRAPGTALNLSMVLVAQGRGLAYHPLHDNRYVRHKVQKV